MATNTEHTVEDVADAAMQVLKRLKAEIYRVSFKAVEGRSSSVMGGRGTGFRLEDSYHAEGVAWLDEVRHLLGVLAEEAP
jgi:hypothetical protein